MRTIRSASTAILFFVLTAVITFGLLSFINPASSNEDGNTEADSSTDILPVNQELNIMALGDSLTEGVGDSSRRGGYVPLAAASLEDKDLFSNVETFNAGKSGAVAAEVMEMIQTNEEVEAEIAAADVVVLSVGGNNLVRTFRQTGLNPTRESLESPLTEYQQDLTALFNEIRSWNEDAPIYVFGIYNPYYYYFSDIEPLQEVVDTWNQTTEEVTEEYDKMYFIPIDHLFNSLETVVSGEEIDEPAAETDTEHPYLFEGDYFHPNDEGYRMMADALVQKIEESVNGEESE